MIQQRIHPPDVIGKYAPDSVIGKIGGGGGGAVAGGAPAAGGGGGGISMAEVGKHNTKSDCWVPWLQGMNLFEEAVCACVCTSGSQPLFAPCCIFEVVVDGQALGVQIRLHRQYTIIANVSYIYIYQLE